MCPSSNSLNGNGIGLLNNNSHHQQNNNGSASHQHSHHALLHSSSNSSSDRCSSSGVSSYDPSESRLEQRVLIPAPSLVSDDSNHSSHSHGSAGLPVASIAAQQPRPPPHYKFKNSIKQRFSADQRVKTPSSPPPASAEAAGAAASKQGVPIFALHDNGGFYIPLTVEAALLRPHLGFAPADLGPETVLHPVTISVNFNHSTPPAWSHQSPTHQIQ